MFGLLRRIRGLSGILRNPTPRSLPADVFWIAHHGKPFVFRVSGEKDHIENSMRSTQCFYERNFLSDISRRLGAKKGVVVDVGANIGNHAVFFAGVGQRDVLAFEPVPRNLALLFDNIALNGQQHRITVLGCALGAEIGTVRLSLRKQGNFGTFSIVDSAVGDTVEAEMRTLDSVLLSPDGRLSAKRPVALVKIDTEGHELSVLRGALGVIERDAPLIAAECETLGAFQAIREILASAGYRPVSIANVTPTVVLSASRDDLDATDACVTRIGTYEQSMQARSSAV